MELEFGKHWVENLSPYIKDVAPYLEPLKPFKSFLNVNMDTLIAAWTVMAVLVVFGFIITRRLTRIPDGLQAFAEMIMDFVEGLTRDQIGKESKRFVPLIGSLFLFILFSNLLGELPLKLYHLKQGDFASPTNDINVTAALAIIVSIVYLGSGIAKKGIGYFKHYFQPIWIMAPLIFMEDFTRPLSLAVRLFANILAGEIIIMVLIGLFPIGLDVPMMLFELFVAFIQAFIFSVLAASYIGGALAEDH
ncbi:MAG: F0F1 ATP synthase subunit A [bacterium]